MDCIVADLATKATLRQTGFAVSVIRMFPVFINRTENPEPGFWLILAHLFPIWALLPAIGKERSGSGRQTMDRSADSKSGESLGGRSRARVTCMTTLLAATSMGHALAQGAIPIEHLPVSAACLDLHRIVMTQVANGQITEAELAVSAVLGSGDDHSQDSCPGIILGNMAVFMGVSGRIAEAERLAERSVAILDKVYAPDDTVLLRPLQSLAAARFEQGKTAKAREAFKRMQSIRIQRPEDRALVHGIAGSLLHAEGRLMEAEAEYLAAFRAWEEARKGDTAVAGAILNSLGSLYIEEQRLAEARQALDGALAVFSRAQDAVPMDRIKVLSVRGVLHARQHNWREGEQDLHDALAIADREPWVDPVVLRSLLTNYAYVLRRNHHRPEARSIEARAVALQTDRTTAIVDITELLPKTKQAKK